MRFSRFIPAAFAVMATLPAVVSAQTSITNLDVKFTSGNTVTIGSPFNGTLRPIGPYQAQLNVPGAQPFDVYCIDYDNSFGRNTMYSARILTFSDAVSSIMTYNGVDNFTALQRVLGTVSTINPQPGNSADYALRLKYEAALASQFGAAPATNWDEIHYAMWSFFNTNAIALPSAGQAGAQTQVDLASDAINNGFTDNGWAIILDERAWDNSYTGGYHQALISNSSVVPEPGTYMLVGAGLIGVFGMARRRNRAAK